MVLCTSRQRCGIAPTVVVSPQIQMLACCVLRTGIAISILRGLRSTSEGPYALSSMLQSTGAPSGADEVLADLYLVPSTCS